jgi:hypothetical protein
MRVTWRITYIRTSITASHLRVSIEGGSGMTTNRREFIERLSATAVLGAFPTAAFASSGEATPAGAATAESWDFSWTNALKGKKHRALFDCTDIESGHGVWRASIWENHYQQALGANAADIKTVLVLRHKAVVLAFQQPLWEAAGIGAGEKVLHPVTQQSTDLNPVLLSSARSELPEGFDAFALPRFISRGGIVLACHLALQNFAGRWAQRAGISPEDATKRTIAGVVPGVVLMPSGILACVKAQEEGCHYVKAS